MHDEIGTNQCFDWGWIEDNREATDAAIKGAHHVTTLELVNNRLVPNAMEPRCSMAEYNRASDEYVLHTTSQNPHLTWAVALVRRFTTMAKRPWCWPPPNV